MCLFVFFFCFTVFVVESFFLVVFGLLEIGFVICLKIDFLGDVILLLFWVFIDSNFMGGFLFLGVLLMIGDGEGSYMFIRERFFLDLFLFFSSCFF